MERPVFPLPQPNTPCMNDIDASVYVLEAVRL